MEEQQQQQQQQQQTQSKQSSKKMSLPGAGTAPTEQPTILLINQINGTTEDEQQQRDLLKEHTKDADNGITDQLDSSSLKFKVSPTTNNETNVLDIESHLIETINSYPVQDDSIGINELQPIDDELKHGTSKIETATNKRSVIEVEPVGAKTKQAIKTLVTTHQTAEETNNSSSNIFKGPVEIETDKQNLEISEEIRKTAENLVNEIEKEVLETLSRHAKDVSTNKVLDNNEVIEDEEKEESKTEHVQAATTLTEKVDAQLTEVTSILKTKPQVDVVALHLEGVAAENLVADATNVDTNVKPTNNELKIVQVPTTPNTPLDAAERKLFLDSLPQIEQNEQADANKLSADCKREYYQSLKKYLLESSLDKPPVPLQTYRWEDLRRARERGGYPWTHLYKRPLGADEEPEIVLLLRKSQELRFTSESPKSLKKVRYDEQVLVKETERYIQDLTDDEEDEEDQTTDQSFTETPTTEDTENHSLHSECISCVSDSVLAVGHAKPRKTNRLAKIRSILKRRRSGRTHEDAQSLPGTSVNTSRHSSVENLDGRATPPPGPLVPTPNAVKSPEHKSPRCYPIMKKLKSMADRQKKRLNIKRITLKKDEQIVLADETKILKLKSSPKSERGEIPHFIEKQDSDDILEIVELDESPSRKRNKDDRRDDEFEQGPTTSGSILKPDEVIEIAIKADDLAEAPIEVKVENEVESAPPKRTPRLRREHVYEEIEQGEQQTAETTTSIRDQLNDILEISSVEELKKSLTRQDHCTLEDIEAAKAITLDRMGSSEEEQIAPAATAASNSLLAPISSIDSTSSDEDRNRAQLSPVAEESDAASTCDANLNERETANVLRIVEANEQIELKPSIKKEASPAPSDKKVTFSHVEDEAEPHREDIELPDDVREAAAANSKWKNMSDHEYEPIGVPPTGVQTSIVKESTPVPTTTITSNLQNGASKLAMDIESLRNEMQEATELQKEMEERYLSSEATTPRTESRTDYEIHTSQVDSSALEELPLQPENRKKSFMATAQDRTRKMQAGIRTQAGKLKTKLRAPPKKAPSGSPKAKERKRFKAPEFSKMKMPEMKKPDMSRLKEIKRPEFTKFSKPDMSKFKLPEKFHTLNLRRSKSFKENEQSPDEEMSPVTPESSGPAESQPQKKKFEFNFGTYPRAFRKKKKPVEPLESSLGTAEQSIIPSTETQPSMESSSSPQGDRGPGPVRSRWADKFSDVSYNDSEGSRYRRYGSEQESFDRESSLERRMKEDLEDTGSEAHDMGILGGVADSKQFAEFDEENRAIHEISNLRSGEFKRRPIVHQDSDLRSEDSKEAVGWTDKEIQKNKLLRKAELEAEASYFKYQTEEGITHDAQSTASSGKKVVMEEIDDDEFFLRKRGISEDNIELRQYISKAIREGYDMPINALEHVGQTGEEFGDYDVPPPKPRRLHKSYRPEYGDSQEFQRSDYGDDLSMSQNGSDFLVGAPKRPMRKGRSRSKYSVDSQDIPMADEGSNVQYFDDDEDYLRPPPRNEKFKHDGDGMNNLDFIEKQTYETDDVPRPRPPRRQKRRTRDDNSMEKDEFINGFGGRSVSNSYLQPTEDVIVYRTEHEYHIPLATPENYTDGASASSRKSRSVTRFDEDDRTSRGADSLALDHNLKSDIGAENTDEKFVIDMMENDGYAVVRKEPMPKPTPPARRKKFSRSPGERFATLPNTRMKRNTPPPERPPPPQGYVPSTDSPMTSKRKSSASLDTQENYEEDDYEEPEALERPESPRNLQTGEIINRMKLRPLPAPPRPPREKRQRGERKDEDYRYDDSDRVATSSTADSYDQNADFEVEVSTQTDPLPDDFICEEFEITEDMKVIEPRRTTGGRTLEELLKLTQSNESEDTPQLTEDEQLARGLQRFRDANQRSISERSRASSSQADRSKSLSRPQTPSAIVIERRVSTPAPSPHSPTMVEAALIVRPIKDLDLEDDDELRREEEELRREGLLTDSSIQSKSDVEQTEEEAEDEDNKIASSDYAASSVELDAAVEKLALAQVDSDYETKMNDEEVERTMRDSEFEDDVVELKMRDRAYNEKDEEDEETERYSTHYDDDEEDARLRKELAELEREMEMEDALEKELQEEMEKDLARTQKVVLQAATPEILSEEEKDENIIAKVVAETQMSKPQILEAVKDVQSIDHVEIKAQESDYIDEEPIAPPQPPPRRKSTTNIETSPTMEATLTVAESAPMEVTPVQSVVTPQPQLPTHLGELEVERLRVHALQAGQIMVKQLHGAEISADELACKSGNLVVQNIELPPGFIEDIVERVRSTDHRAPLLTVETQTSRQASSETLSTERNSPSPAKEAVRPSKPPRQSKTEPTTEAVAPVDRLSNLDEQTQTEALPVPPVYPSVEYLQSLAPLAFYNLQRGAEAEHEERKAAHKCRRRHQQRKHVEEEADAELESASEIDDYIEDRPLSRRSRTRSGTQPPTTIEKQSKTVTEAGRQFIAACSLELVNIINQLTNFVRGGQNQSAEIQARHIPALVVLFMVITFGLLLFLLTGRNVHTHHWDYFNPPGNDGRQT